jgi:hypothetical protein
MNPTIVSAGGIAPSTDIEIPTYSMPDGKLLLVKYSKNGIGHHLSGSSPSTHRCNTDN